MNEFSIVASCRKADGTRSHSEKRIIAPAPNVITWVEFRSTLTNHDCACFNKFTTKSFNTEHLGVGVATIFGGPHSFLMSHFRPPEIDYSASAGAAFALGAAFFFGAAFFLAADTESIFI